MGCALASPVGDVLAVHSNGPLWCPPDAKRPASEGATIYISMPPCKKCFTVIVSSGVRRIVTRKPMCAQDDRDMGPAIARLGIDFVVIPDSDERKARLARMAAGKRGREEAEAPAAPQPS